MAWNGSYLLKVGGAEFPMKYIKYDSYQVTPQQMVDLDSGRDTTGTMHRTVLPTKCKIEFNMPIMSDAQMDTPMGILTAAFNNLKERKCTVQY